ncbi:Alpha beta hydrolase fold [Seminavis robusta]|uniref:Alpha beta hydrolase fold n=1 Tax=Seminavis robusta TaxID=568900 RepID=A0A9N8DAA9_9STRA|nr:Alpha beta hydrolase fold [Seminavis robusta]|eukprot:Sro63_g035690.1 Alpha beta hydrolase fold (305) ;mRNA; r:36707-37621
MAAEESLHERLLGEPKLNQTIKLKDGRQLGYAEYGTADGPAIFYFHGGNGSRLEAQWFAEAAAKRQIRLIAADRPGFGLSYFQQDRQLRDWANDVQELAAALSIHDKFSIFGLSGGGPFVAALAHLIPERLHRAAIISGTAPPDASDRFQGMWCPVKMIFCLARRLPAMHRVALQQMGKFYADPEQMRKTMLKGMPKPDVTFLERVPIAVDIFSADAREAHRQGIEGDAHEWQLYVNDWGFQMEDISMEIGLWYGRYDVQVTPAMGQYFADTLPKSVYHLVDDGGHFSTINNHIDSIIAYLTES